MKLAFKDFVALVLHWSLEAWQNIGARGAWRGMPLRGVARGDSTKPLNRAARRALLRASRGAKPLNRPDLERAA